MKRNTEWLTFSNGLSTLMLITWFVLIFVDFTCNDIEMTPCIQHSSFIKEERYEGIVTKKFIDAKNHNYKKVIFKKRTKENFFFKEEIEEDFFIANDALDFYNEVEVGDSISKRINSDTFNIYKKNNVIKSYVIDFGCKEINNK